MLPAAILFDLDDTLISPHLHRKTFWNDSICQIWEETNGSLENLPKNLGTLVDQIDIAAQVFWSDPNRHKTGRLNLRKARYEILNNGMGLDKQFNQDTRWTIADRCGQLMFDKTTLYPDAISTLVKLRNNQVRLALVTNGTSTAQREKIRKFSLETYFEHIQIEGEAGVGKPELEAYKKAMKALRVTASETWMVGDNLEWEVIAPQQLGIFSIWRDPRGDGTLPKDTAAKPDMIITKLSELVTNF